jgi:predicted Zn-dependent peptidase
MEQMKSVSLGIWINVGGRYENKRNAGISHFLEHLLFKGSKRYSGKEIKESIEGVGGSLNGFTSEEFTCYLVKVVGKYLNQSLNVLSDMVINPKLTSQDIEKERGVIKEEIKMYRDLPMHYVHELLNQLLWPEQPLGMNLAGTLETISQIKRKDILKYKEKFYNPQNLVVACAGPIKDKELLREVDKHFSNIPSGKKSQFQKARMSQDKPQTNLYFKDTEQTHISLGTHSFRRDHPDKYTLGLLHIILGGNMSSRLFQEVREKRGLAYEISTHIKWFQDAGAFTIDAGVDNKRIIQALKVILQELKKIKKFSVNKSEFLRAKEYYTGQLLLALEDTMEHMFWIGESTVSLDKVYTLEEVLQELEQVKIEDIKRVANKIFRNKGLNLALIGPITDKEKLKIEGVLDVG